MSWQIDSEQTVTANSSASNQINFPSASNTAESLVLFFHGDHSQDLKLVQSSGDTEGIPIASGASGSLGPFPLKSNPPSYLYAGSSTDATVTLLPVEDADNSISGSALAGSGGLVASTTKEYFSSSPESKTTVKGSSGKLGIVRLTVPDGNAGSGARYLQVWDGGTSSGTLVDEIGFQSTSGETGTIGFDDSLTPTYCDTDITVAHSTDSGTYTAAEKVEFKVKYS